MSELFSFSKTTRFFSKPLYQTSSNAVVVIPIDMVGMVKYKKDNVLKPNDIPAPRLYRIQFHFFLDP